MVQSFLNLVHFDIEGKSETQTLNYSSLNINAEDIMCESCIQINIYE